MAALRWLLELVTGYIYWLVPVNYCLPGVDCVGAPGVMVPRCVGHLHGLGAILLSYSISCLLLAG